MEFVLTETCWRRVPGGQIGVWVPSAMAVPRMGPAVAGCFRHIGFRRWEEAGVKSGTPDVTCTIRVSYTLTWLFHKHFLCPYGVPVGHY